MRVIVWVLVASNVVLGVFSVYSLREADRRYAELIDRSVPVMNDLQTLTARAAQAMAGTNLGRLVRDGKSDGIGVAKAVLTDEAEFRQQVLRAQWVSDDPSQRQPIRITGEAFTAAADAVLALVRGGNLPAAALERETKLLPSFYSYIDAITAVADVLQADSERVTAAVANRTGRMATIVLGMASWPVLIVLGLLLITLLLIGVLMIVFRGSERADASQ
jgi:hypothetical protein